VALTDTAVLHYAYAEFEEARGGIKVCFDFLTLDLMVLVWCKLILEPKRFFWSDSQQSFATHMSWLELLVVDQEAKGVYETLISNDSTANALAYIQVSGLDMSVLLSCWVISSLPITKVIC
jgi:hypothetical protein